jgi:DNA polymerase-3 subunit delta
MNACFLFIGPDRGRQQAEIQKVTQALKARLKDEPETISYYADQDDIDKLLANLRNGSLFYPHLLAIVNRCESFTPTEVKKIQAYWQKPNSQCTVIFTSEEYSEVKDKFKFVPKDQMQVFWEVDDKEKPGWLRAYIQRKGGTIESDALELLCELVESDTLSMQRECDTLLIVRPDHKVTLADVEAYIFHSREENVYTLFEMVLALDFDAALAALQKIILSQEADPVQVVIGLQWQFRNLLALKRKAGRGPAPREMMYEFRIRQPRSQQIHNKALREWELEDIEKRLHALSVYDLQVRQTRSGMQSVLLELMLHQLINNPAFGALLQEERYGLFEV